ncbi:hypothetical protein E3Q23_04403 [Wallemia mellicola]|uniref:Uncharacterized protein n=1 Tax=Wallemia mellicola TaxID=1708541 RepID=A0A4T0P7N3_9BASI|nr:hypothetical protein E3Q23_04403 [Wallemia mellicola]TIC05799.1 hypothetical protein E3Q15_04479 [Wallemia mellicola]TIC06255.1 hypothetical protein E3Q14_04468 [Wallemia mellicola]TIC21294.1 hypothetical protein E3Q11_04437 [Wallemia mellicola]TIC61107.1 hypothetical protein E3Q01_04428 [Wallemia mellicola]
MFKSLALVAILATYVTAGGSEVCLNKQKGCVEYQITKDCCAHVDQSARFEESTALTGCLRTCIPYTANGINTGDMVDCCEGRGAGSKGGLTVDDQAQQKVCGRN